ncbi:MAG: Crp/Fnr family transcriptional regulator [Clostridia bacterium]|nr:Crp/Fnr family transcriptional regulator [Clostridia bacterium]
MEKYIKILENCPLFEGIDDDSLSRMLVCLGAKIKTYGKKAMIMSEGMASGEVGIMLSGRAQITQTDYYGNRNIFSKVGPYEVFNEAFACAQTKSLPVSIVADEPCCVMFIDCDHILHTCSNNCGFHQQLIYNLMKDLAMKTIRFHEKIEATSKRTTREKLLAYLNICAKKQGNTFSIPFDRQELADYLEVDRSGLSAEISKLRKEGVLTCRKNQFSLL